MLAPKRACMHVSIRFFSASSISKQTTRTRNSVIYSNTLITKHGKNGDIKAAESVFNRMPCKNIISWTAMLTAYSGNGLIKKARKLFDEMPDRSVESWNAILSGYIRNRVGVDETLQIFLKMPERNAVSYGVMLNGLVQAGRFDKAEKLYNEVPLSLRDPVSSNVLISGYVKVGKLEEAVRVFEGMGKRNVVSWTSMLNGYCKEGKISEARELFSKIPERNVITWTSMIHGYLKMGCFEDGFRFFLHMRHEDSVEVSSNTLTILLEACGRLGRYVEACQLHALVLQMGLGLDVFLGNTVITMYCRFGCIDAAANIFHMIDKKDTVSWNSIIAGYVQSGDVDQAFELFKQMPEKDVVSWTTMIKGFSSNGSIEKSIELFEMMPDQGDDVAWTAVISGLENNGEYEKAICWFMNMLRRDVRPNPLTFSSVLSSSASLAILNQGQQLHVHVLKMDMDYDLSIQNSLVSMYSKCGSLGDAYRIFNSICDPNVVSFNSMLTGFSQNEMDGESDIMQGSDVTLTKQTGGASAFKLSVDLSSQTERVEGKWRSVTVHGAQSNQPAAGTEVPPKTDPEGPDKSESTKLHPESSSEFEDDGSNCHRLKLCFDTFLYQILLRRSVLLLTGQVMVKGVKGNRWSFKN